MIHETVLIVYRLIVLFILGCTVWGALDKESDVYSQITAALLAIPLVLRLLMIK
jgi:hypothetical protein